MKLKDGLVNPKWHSNHNKLYSASRIQEISKNWEDSPVCQFSEMWYLFLLSVAFVYYMMAVLSMIFTKESGRLREISLLHDNLIMSIMLPSLLEWLVIPSENLSTRITTIYLAPDHEVQFGTCGIIVFLYSSLQTTSITALAYTVYAEKYILPRMNCIKPKPVCSISLVALETMAGVVVTIATILIGGSVMKGTAKDCCLHSTNVGSFEKTRDVIFSVSSIYATYILLRVSVDRFLKLLATGHQRRPKTILYNRHQIS